MIIVRCSSLVCPALAPYFFYFLYFFSFFTLKLKKVIFFARVFLPFSCQCLLVLLYFGVIKKHFLFDFRSVFINFQRKNLLLLPSAICRLDFSSRTLALEVNHRVRESVSGKDLRIKNRTATLVDGADGFALSFSICQSVCQSVSQSICPPSLAHTHTAKLQTLSCSFSHPLNPTAIASFMAHLFLSSLALALSFSVCLSLSFAG